MDQIKIGQFISECRKAKNLTQAALAEKLGITDRAVSKWERGRGLPDPSIMLDLCSELDINVNELLNGERISMNNYDKKAEELMLQMAEKEKRSAKNLLTAMWVIIFVSIIFLFASCGFAAYFLPEGPIQLAVVIGAVVIVLIACFFALKLEVEAGYYRCKSCGHRFVPTYRSALNAMHMGTTRYLKCPDCNKRTWCKKVLSKDD